MTHPIDVTQWEQWYCGYLISHPEKAGRFLRRWPSDRCQDPLVRTVLDQVQAWETAGEPWQMTTVFGALPDSMVPLMDWVRDALDMVSLPDQLVADLEAAWVRDQTTAVLRMAQQRTGTDGPEAAWQWAEDEIAQVRAVAQATTHTLDQVQAVLAFLSWAERRQDPEATPVLATPWPLLNTVGGGLAPEDLVVVAARPSVGKTSLALQLAVKVAQSQTPVLYLSYEMSYQRCLAQIASQQYGVDRYRLSHGRLRDEDWNTVTRSLGGLGEWPIWWWRNGDGPGFPEIAAEVDRLSDKGLGLLVVDYLEMVPRAGGPNPSLELQGLIYAFKGLARRYDLPVVVCAQLGRQADDPHRAPRLSDLAWSSGIEKAADKVWMLQPLESGRKRRVWIRKHRDGPLGIVDMDWDGPRSRMTQCAEQPRPGEVEE